jgi:hypothetical protein
MSRHALLYLLDTLLFLPLLGQRPATLYHAHWQMSQTPVLVTERAHGFGLLLNGLYLV